MNEQYSVSRLRGGFRNPDHSEDPIHWSSLDQQTVGGYLCNLYVYTHTLSQIYERRQK